MAEFKPSPAAAKLFGIGYAFRSVATVASSGLAAVLLPPTPVVRMSYVLTQRSEVAVAHSGTNKAPVLGFTSRVELRVMVLPPMTSALAGSGTK